MTCLLLCLKLNFHSTVICGAMAVTFIRGAQRRVEADADADADAEAAEALVKLQWRHKLCGWLPVAAENFECCSPIVVVVVVISKLTLKLSDT